MVFLLLRILCLALMLFMHLQLSYNFNQSWWHSAAGTAVVLLLGWVIWRKRFVETAGLSFRLKELPMIFAFTGVITVMSFLVMKQMGAGSVEISFTGPRHYIHNFFYIINEEIVLGALMLYFLTRRLSLRSFFASALLAALVAVAHLVLYKWYFRDKGLLLGATLAGLFLVVFAKNNLIIRTGNVGYAWGLHFGWMVVMYGCVHTYPETGVALNDLEKFNLYLGSPLFVLIAAIIAAATVFVRLPQRAERGSV